MQLDLRFGCQRRAEVLTPTIVCTSDEMVAFELNANTHPDHST
jgi:hypothetical protein